MTTRLMLICFLLVPSAHALELRSVIGTWELVSYVLTEDGRERPWCKAPFGIISYAPNGYMAVGINCRDVDAGKVTPDPKDMVFYSGKFSIKAPSTLVHHVENSSDISRIGKDLERTVDVEKGQLILRGMGVKGPVKLVWRKRK